MSTLPCASSASPCRSAGPPPSRTSHSPLRRDRSTHCWVPTALGSPRRSRVRWDSAHRVAGTVRIFGLDPTATMRGPPTSQGSCSRTAACRCPPSPWPCCGTSPASTGIRLTSTTWSADWASTRSRTDRSDDSPATAPARRARRCTHRQPALVFLDEPTAGLDPQARIAVDEVVQDLRAAGAAIVLTTHDMADAERLADFHGHRSRPRDRARHRARTDGDGGGRCSGKTARIVLDGDPPESALIATRSGGDRPCRGERHHAGRTPAASDLHRVTGVLADHALDVRSFDYRGKSLGDVFLELTGRSLR